MTGRWDNGSMFIDGAWTPDDTAIVGEVIDLATEVVIGSVPDADPKAAHAAIAAARRAFDDGPWPDNTPKVLKALTDNCSKATFFEIGEHATWRPDLSKMLAAAGMTIGSHTWSHKDLAKNPYAKDIEQAKQEIEMGVSGVHMAVDGPIAPFFRFPDLQQPAELMTYLGTRNIATFSTDIDSFDFKIRKPEDVVKSVLTKLQKNGKGMILMHDFQHATAEAMPELLHQLKLAGYKVVHMVPKQAVTTLAKYDDMVRTQDKFSTSNNTRPESSVVKTISE